VFEHPAHDPEIEQAAEFNALLRTIWTSIQIPDRGFALGGRQVRERAVATDWRARLR